MGKRFAISGVLFLLCGMAAVSSTALAQNPSAAIESSRLRSSEAGPQFQSQSLPLGANVEQLALRTSGDLDLGVQLIMKRQEREEPFRIFADTAEFFTSNVALTRTGARSDSYFFGDVGFTYNKHITDDLQVEATVRQSFFRYSTYSRLDFEDMNAGTGLTYQLKKVWDVTVFGRYNFERMTQENANRDFFRNSTITIGAQKTFSFNNGNYAYFGYSSIFGFSAPTSAERDEHGIFAGAHYNFSRQLSAELYYRIAAFPYTVGRTDLNQTAVLTLAYAFNDYARLTASVSFTSDRSNHSVYDYDVANTGGGLAFQLRF